MRISDWSSDVCSSDLPCRCHRAVDRPKQTAVTRPRHRADKFEAFARRSVDRHAVAGLVPHRRLEKGRGAGPDMLQIGDERANRGDFAARKMAEAVERLNAEKEFEPFLPGRSTDR